MFKKVVTFYIYRKIKVIRSYFIESEYTFKRISLADVSAIQVIFCDIVSHFSVIFSVSETS